MTPYDVGSTDQSLIRLVQEDEPDAWRRFVDLYGPYVFGWARRFGLSSDDAADVTQDAFLAVARAIQGFQHDAGNSTLRGWLWTITRNKTHDWLRRRELGEQGAGGSSMLRQLHEMPEQPPEDSDPAEATELAKLVHRGLMQLQGDFEPRTWQAFWLVVVEGRETKDVAGQLGMTANHVRQSRSRVLRRLREHLGDTG